MKSVSNVILDAGPILKDDPSVSTLLASCDALFTVPSVLSELRDPDIRTRVDTTLKPFLVIRSPTPSSIKFISDFARKTGDLAVLSKIDVEVLALAYEVECEKNGGDGRLRNVPGQKHLNGIPPKDQEFPSGGIAVSGDERQSKDVDSTDLQEPLEQIQPVQKATSDLESLNLLVDPSAQSCSSLQYEVDAEEKHAVSDQVEDTDSSDSDGWITPSNIKTHQATNLDTATLPISKENVMQVATITTDYAMQNVLLQVGLSLISPSLQRIRNIRTYILRCHACFEKVRDISKQFCPRCGKPTLTRVTRSTNLNGQFQIHLKKNMQWNHRGDRYSAPKPVSGSSSGKIREKRGGGKGGWGQELILAEDQKEYQRALNGRGKKGKGTDLMDEDYLPGILTGERRQGWERPKIGAGRNANSKRRS